MAGADRTVACEQNAGLALREARRNFTAEPLARYDVLNARHFQMRSSVYRWGQMVRADPDRRPMANG